MFAQSCGDLYANYREKNNLTKNPLKYEVINFFKKAKYILKWPTVILSTILGSLNMSMYFRYLHNS